MQTLNRETGAAYLKTQWHMLDLPLGDENNDLIPADTIECFPVRFAENCPAVIVKFPPAERITEAYFAAIVKCEKRRGFLSKRVESSYRYFTLEKSIGGTVLGEWAEGRHGNLGDGPPPNKEDFIQAIAKLIHE